MKLYCIKSFYMNNRERSFTKGKIYDCEPYYDSENLNNYLFNDDQNDLHIMDISKNNGIFSPIPIFKYGR